VAAVGVTFRDDEKNTALWKRWMGFLKLDMWLVFFGGAMIGMYLPIILMRQLMLLSGQEPTQANVPTSSPTSSTKRTAAGCSPSRCWSAS
jgi:hypothetical protein